MYASDRRCPVCNSGRVEGVYSVTSRQAALHLLDPPAEDARLAQLEAHIERLWCGSLAWFMRCEDCTFCFAHPFVAGDGPFYAEAYESGQYPGWKWEHEATLQALVRSVGRLPADRALLEVGAGDGAFIRGVVPQLFSAPQVVCTEFSPRGRHSISGLGVQCLAADLRGGQLDAMAGRFDVVCMFQVLEHLDCLDEAFARLGKLTRPRAALFVAVPNHRQRELFDRMGVHEDVPPTHVGRWTAGAMEIMARRFGWRVREARTEPEGMLSKAATLCLRRYRAHRSLAGLARRMAPRLVRRALTAALVVAVNARVLPALPELAGAAMGTSAWFHLQKE